jgi:hypothetical protein
VSAPDRLPDELVEPALTLGRPQRRGFFDEVGERLRLRRKAGSYVGVDLVPFLFCDATDPWTVLAHPSVQARDHRGALQMPARRCGSTAGCRPPLD